MKQYIEKDFGKILKRNALQMRRVMNDLDSDVIRIYDRNLHEIPVTVDLYGVYARITDYSDDVLTEDEIEKICDVVSRNAYVEPDRIIYHKREKREEGEQHTETGGEPLTLDVKENGLLFRVDLTSRIDTGLFLDQMPVRKALKDGAEGKSVLNLFSYTGSFSVYAASGGARSVVSVDLSKTYSDWCEENLKRNGFFGDQFKIVNQDALSYIAEAKEQHTLFDIIIFDPPSFSNSRKMDGVFDVQKDHADILNSLWDLLTPSGILYFSTNLSRFRMNKRELNGFAVNEVTSEYRAPGFSSKRTSMRNWVLVKQKRYHKGGQMGSTDRRERKGSKPSFKRDRDDRYTSRSSRDEKGGYPKKSYRGDDRDDSRRDRRNDGERDFRRDRNNDGGRDFRRDNRSDSRGDFRRDRNNDGGRDFRRDNRSDSRGDFRRDRNNDGGRDFRRDSRSDSRGDFRRDRNNDGGRDFRRDSRSDSRGDFRRDRNSDGGRDFRRDSRSDSRGDFRRDRNSDGGRDFRRDNRNDSRGDFRRDRDSEGGRDFRRDNRSDSRGDFRRDRNSDGGRDFRRDNRNDSRGDFRRDNRESRVKEDKVSLDDVGPLVWDDSLSGGNSERSFSRDSERDSRRPPRRDSFERKSYSDSREDRPRRSREDRPFREKRDDRDYPRTERDPRTPRTPRKPKLYGFDAPKRSKRSSGDDEE